MAKQNYSFEKRQKEIAKKKKEKRLKKTSAAESNAQEDQPSQQSDTNLETIENA